MLQTINALLPILGFLVATIVAGVSVYIYWKKGGNQASSEVIATYREQVSQLKEQVAAMQATINTLTHEVGKLGGMLQEKEKNLASLKELITNRNPEMVTLLGEIRTFMQKLNEKAERSKAILEGQEERRKLAV